MKTGNDWVCPPLGICEQVQEQDVTNDIILINELLQRVAQKFRLKLD